MANYITQADSFFRHRDEFDTVMNEIVTYNGDSQYEISRSVEHAQKILYYYVPMPTILDECLDHIVSTMFKEIEMIVTTIDASYINSDQTKGNIIIMEKKLHACFEVLYWLCNIRGYKTVYVLFPHEVNLLEPVVHYIQRFDTLEENVWKSTYICLLWLAMLLMTPFPLHSINSENHYICISIDPSVPLDRLIYTLCSHYIYQSGPIQKSSCICLYKLIIRPDTTKDVIDDYLSTVFKALNTNEKRDEENSISTYELVGVLLCFKYILKNGNRSQFQQLLYPHLQDIVHALSTYASIFTSATIYLYICKVALYISLLFLDDVQYSWRYRRNHNDTLVIDEDHKSLIVYPDIYTYIDMLTPVIDIYLQAITNKDSSLRWKSAKYLATLTSLLPSKEYGGMILESIYELLNSNQSDIYYHGGLLALAELVRQMCIDPIELNNTICKYIVKGLYYSSIINNTLIESSIKDVSCYITWCIAHVYNPSDIYLSIDQLYPRLSVLMVLDKEVNCRRAAQASFQECVGRMGGLYIPHGIDIIGICDYLSIANIKYCYTILLTTIMHYKEYQKPMLDYIYTTLIYSSDEQVRDLASGALFNIFICDPEYYFSTILDTFLCNCTHKYLYKRIGSLEGIISICKSIYITHYTISDETKNKLLSIIPTMRSSTYYKTQGNAYIRQYICQLISIFIQLDFYSYSLQSNIMDILNILEENVLFPSESVQISVSDCYHYLSWFLYNQHINEVIKNNEFIIENNNNNNISDNNISDNNISDNNISDNKISDNKNATISLYSFYIQNMLDSIQKGFMSTNTINIHGYSRVLSQLCIYSFPTSEILNSILSLLETYIQPSSAIDIDGKVLCLHCIFSIISHLCIYKPKDVSDYYLDIYMRSIEIGINDYTREERGDVGLYLRKEAMEGIRMFYRMLNKHLCICDLQGNQYAIEYYIYSLIYQQIYYKENISLDIKDQCLFDSDEYITQEGRAKNSKDIENNRENIIDTLHPECISLLFDSNTTIDPLFGSELYPEHLYFYSQNKVYKNHKDYINSLFNQYSNMIQAIQNQLNGSCISSSIQSISILLDQLALSTQYSSIYSYYQSYWLSHSTCCIGYLLKQMSEQLNFSREKASFCLLSVLYTPFSSSTLIPEYKQLCDLFTNDISINFVDASVTLPLIMKCMNIDIYREYIVKGLIFSLGGIGLDIVETSTTAFLQYIDEDKKIHGHIGEDIFIILIQLLKDTAINDIIFSYLIKTILLFMEQGYLEYIYNNHGNHEIVVSLLDSLGKKVGKVSSIPSLCIIRDIYIKLFDYKECKIRSIKMLMWFLGHQYPVVRRSTSEQLYLYLSSIDIYDDQFTGNSDIIEEISELLSSTNWNDKINTVRSIRDQVQTLFNQSKLY
ncbi:hypothetical protein WA158_002179 [Blastocystis sp. Blastoise]